MGELIINSNFVSKIDLSKYSNGIYDILIIYEGKAFNYKIIKR